MGYLTEIDYFLIEMGEKERILPTADAKKKHRKITKDDLVHKEVIDMRMAEYIKLTIEPLIAFDYADPVGSLDAVENWGKEEEEQPQG